jgi:hypothetical protein
VLFGSADQGQRRRFLSDRSSPTAFVAISGRVISRVPEDSRSFRRISDFFASGKIHNRRRLAFLGLHFFNKAELIADGVK